LQVYRLVRRAFAGEDAFSGDGPFRFGGRWSSVGTRVSYASAHRSLAVLEYQAHIDAGLTPGDLVMAVLVIPDDLRIERAGPLPEGWQRSPAPEALRAIGRRFVAARESVAMLVPSVIVPGEDNVLINPRHPDMRWVRREPELMPFPYEARMM